MVEWRLYKIAHPKETRMQAEGQEGASIDAVNRERRLS